MGKVRIQIILSILLLVTYLSFLYLGTSQARIVREGDIILQERQIALDILDYVAGVSRSPSGGGSFQVH